MQRLHIMARVSVIETMLCALMVLILANSAHGTGRSLHFGSSLSELHVDSGSIAYLQCILDGDPSHGERFDWTGPAVDSDRASISLDISGTVSTLTIDSVGDSDEGRYSCSYTGVGTVSTTLNIQFDPHFFNVSEYQEFIEETDAVVECPAFFGDPPGHMIWSRDDRSITDNRFTVENGRMRIQNIRESDEATYRCSINRLGIIDSRYIIVAVLERSELAPKIIEPPNPIEVRYGDPLDLTCELEVQRDDVDYTWIVNTDFEDSHNKSTIPSLYRDVNHFLSGRYTCKAENEYGYDEQVFAVRIMVPPEPATCSEQEETRNEGETVVLEHCQITSPVQPLELVYRWSKRSQNGQLVEIRPGGRFAVNHDGFLTITDIQPSDSGLYEVNISNSQGSALHTVQLRVIPMVTTPTVIRVTLRFESSGSEGISCQDIKEMKISFTNTLEIALCDRLDTCSDETEIELRDSRVECLDPDSKVGIYSATLRGPNAAKVIVKIEQLGEFHLHLRELDRKHLTLNFCGDDCPRVNPHVQNSDTMSSVIAIGMVAVVVLIVLVVVGASLLTIILRSKCGKTTHLDHNHNVKSETTGHILTNTDESAVDYLCRLPQSISVESLCRLEQNCYEATDQLQESLSFGDQTLTINHTKRPSSVIQESCCTDQGCYSTSDQSQAVFNLQSFYFTEAEKNEVIFVYYQLLECDSNGREYTIVDHDITMKIPQGAVPEGQTIHFEVAVAMYGPFIFPNNTRPISPILWLCIMEEGFELKKPFKLILPHFITGQTKDQILNHQVHFAKASHYNHILQNEHIYYKFLPSEEKSGFAFNGCRGYGVLESNHCCFYCLQANQTPELATDAGYCLIRIESSLILQRSEVYFTAIYFLDSCLKSLEEQFPSEEGYRICRYDDFKFKPNKSDKPYIKVVAPSEHDQCVIGMEPMTAEIRASDIDFWGKGFEDMRRRHQRRMYPPRVKMTVSLRNPDFTLKLPVKFAGCLSDSQLDVELTFPLGFMWSQSLSLSTVSSASSGSQAIICDKPKLKDVFKELLPHATEWKTVGTLLGIEEHILDKIKCDEEGTRDRLQKMLSEWLKQIDPLPTWKELADAMEAVDALKAQELRTRSVDIAQK